jgi:hypothetical protein
MSWREMDWCIGEAHLVLKQPANNAKNNFRCKTELCYHECEIRGAAGFFDAREERPGRLL